MRMRLKIRNDRKSLKVIGDNENKKQSKINWIAFILIKEPEPLFLSILEQSGRILILHLHLIQPLKFHEHHAI